MLETIWVRALRLFEQTGQCAKMDGVEFNSPPFLAISQLFFAPLKLSQKQFAQLEESVVKLLQLFGRQSMYFPIVRQILVVQTMQWLKATHPFPGLDEALKAHEGAVRGMATVQVRSLSKDRKLELFLAMEQTGQAVVDVLVPFIQKRGVQEAILKWYKVGRLHELRFYVPPDKWR